MTPKQQYLENINKLNFKKDPAQEEAVEKLDLLYHQFMAFVNEPKSQEEPQNKSIFSKLFGNKFLSGDNPESKTSINREGIPKGLYFWGGVGRGKTYLMDLFFDALPHQKKMRMHFHRFMQRVHQELGNLQQVSDPLEIVADRIKEETDIICFDEFFVSDITDAMLLGTLFQALFDRGMVLVATSNIPPHDLYRNGLQRARFLPAIEMIQQNCIELNVDSGVDYRLRTLEQATIYHTPLSNEVSKTLDDYFNSLTRLTVSEASCEIEINNRQLEVKANGEGVLYATFEQLCSTARSQSDFIELSRLYHTVILADVKQMSAINEDAARRFIALVDEFYERHVTLIISAEVDLDKLYLQGRLEFEFQRCQSRLIEMQSVEYLSQEHLA